MKPSSKIPLLAKRPDGSAREDDSFPVDHISASSMISFSTNPVMFKIKYLNRERIDSTSSVSSIIGKAFHFAMESYYSNEYENESEAMEAALKAGVEYMDQYPEGWIEWSKTVPTRQKAVERVSFAITAYIRESKFTAEETIACEDKIEELVDVEWHGKRYSLPVKLKGFVDRVTRGKDGLIRGRDYKTCSSFSDLDKIDGGKIIQAIEYFFLIFAKYGEPPYSMTFEEVKVTPNREPGPQVVEYEVVYEDNPLYFDFYFRFLEDMIRAMGGEMVYVPNVRAMFDNEVSIVAYIQRLDDTAEVAERKKSLGVETMNEVLKADIANTGNMRKLLKAVEDDLTTAKAIDYANMQNDEKIRTKMMEHGIVLKFDSLLNGASVDLYRFAPSIGVKMSKLRQYADDIQQVLGSVSVRVIAPIPGTSLIGFEVPRLEDRRFPTLPKCSGYDFAIGETVDGLIRRFDLRDAPHSLVAGSSGSGKSVFLHGLIRQLMETDAIIKLYDPKCVEFRRYKNKVSEYQDEKIGISASLAYLVDEMNARYEKLAASDKRDAKEAGIQPIFVVIDEFADLVVTERRGDKSVIVDMVQLLSQKGRAAGIHLIIATQRASTKIIPGDLKVNFPVKAVFRMAKAVDSQVMIDEDGAEKLIGRGDMLFATDYGIERLQAFNSVV